MKKVLLQTLALLLTVSAFAQIKTPAPSPACEWEQAVGLTKIEVEYSRPGVKGRTIFAEDGLVPFGKTWRTGANSATKITIGADGSIGGQLVEAGSYALLTVPSSKEWVFMLYPYEKSSWSSYTEKEAAYTFSAATNQLALPVESFIITTDNLKDNSADLVFAWETTVVKVPVSFEIHETIMGNIKTVLSGPSTNDYYRAATYLYNTDTDMDMALEYIQKATAGDSPRFWMLRREALVLAKLDRKQEAIKAAMRSIEAAKEAGNDDYVRMNEASIAEWKQ